MTRIEQIKALSDNGADASWPLIHELATLVEKQNEALKLCNDRIDPFDMPDEELAIIDEALAAYNEFNKVGG